jgi:hypothetical protein
MPVNFARRPADLYLFASLPDAEMKPSRSRSSNMQTLRGRRNVRMADALAFEHERRPIMTRNLTLAMSFGAALLASSGAYAADIIASDTAPSLQPARMVCESSGRCWHAAPRRDAVIGDTYNRYNGGRVCMDWEGYPCALQGSAELPPYDTAPAYGYRY